MGTEARGGVSGGDRAIIADYEFVPTWVMLTTIRDLQRLALPPSSVLRTDEHGGSITQVRGVASLRSTLPAFPPLHGGELALVVPAQALQLDERLTLLQLVERLADVRVAGIAVTGLISDDVVERAERKGIVLLELPADADLRLIERDIQRLLSDPELQIERRAAQLYSELTQALVGGGGVRSVVVVLGERTGQNVACYSASGRLRAEYGHGTARAAFQLLRPTEGEHQLLGLRVLVRTIGALGGLALAGTSLDSWDTVALQQGVAALALELSKEQAVKAAESRVRGDLLRTILSGAQVDPQSLQAQAAELGFDLQRPHIALVCEPTTETPEVLLNHTQRLLKRRQLAAPLLLREEGLVAFCPVKEPHQPHALLAELQDTVALTAGSSSAVPGPHQWPQALDQAEQALALGSQLFGVGSITAFADLGVYRLLLAQRDTTDLWRFYEETLGTLVEHDGTSGELMMTLEGYFAELGNVSRAAERLHIHRNTLIYRLQRISDITGIDWKHAEDQLALQLALKAHRVLKLIDDGRRNGTVRGR
ncbi:MAG: helix-turn-helix domain-containing protein [Herpetosiphonaceae bacterium]|nr:helix-turn-helix domain-containing protein [Herpetosiphonaceae bacterium]